MKIFLIAGEESGDILGAGLMASLKKKYADHKIEFAGIGGARMDSQGLNSFFPMQELSLMGIAEIFPKIPHLLKRINETIEHVKQFQPDIFVTIDAPDFSFRVAKGLQKNNITVPFKVHYVAPTVWAWRPKRAEKISKLYDAVMCLLPFEPPYFEAEGMKSKFVGHPMSHDLKDIDEKSFIADHDLDKYCPRIGVLLGSRENEVHKMAPVFLEALQKITSKFPDAFIICPTLPHLVDTVKSYFEKYQLARPVMVIHDSESKYQAMKACDYAIATSGTVGLELAVLKVPHVIAYKVSPLTYQIGKRLIKTKYAHLGNILLQEGVVPEFIQGDATSENITNAVLDMVRNEDLKTGQMDGFKKIQEKIKGAENASPSDACADFLIENFKS